MLEGARVRGHARCYRRGFAALHARSAACDMIATWYGGADRKRDYSSVVRAVRRWKVAARTGAYTARLMARGSVVDTRALLIRGAPPPRRHPAAAPP